MLGILRILAIITMLLALTETALVVPNAIRAFNGREGETGQAASESPSKTPPLTERLGSAGRILHSPLFLFCSGAMVYVLVRIASTQEDFPPTRP